MPKEKLTDQALKKRSDKIKSLALEVIKEKGVSGLTMDRVVLRSPYSKGTIYKHYCCKEDLITALAVDGNQLLYQRLNTFQSVTSNTREAITQLAREYLEFTVRKPTYHRLMVYEYCGVFREKSSSQLQHQMTASGNKVLAIMQQIINTALDRKELINNISSPEQITFSLWSIGFGSLVLLQQPPEQCCIRQKLLLEQEFLQQFNLVLDALNWH